MHFDFRSRARDLGIELDDEAVRRFAVYRDRILSAGFNLTAVREPETIERRHFLESIALEEMLTRAGLLTDEMSVIDIGSGAGFPGLPIKIARPALSLRLLESSAKRCGFLRDLIAELGLEGVAVLEGRAEVLGREPEHRGAYDLVLARAVAPLPVLLEYALPFLRPGGRLAALKGSAGTRELDESRAALAELRGQIESVLPFQPPEGAAQSLIVVRQASMAPERYPRRTGIPSKRPLS